MKFNTKEEKKIQNKFIKNGYLIFNIKNKKKLNLIKFKVEQLVIQWFKKKKIFLNSKSINLNYIHSYCDEKEINNLRMYVYNKINLTKNFQKFFYELGRDYIDLICGNELVMQKKCNLSLQMPKDKSSVLPLHSDVWSGDSEFELVFWLPLVNVYRTKSMFIINPKDNEKFLKKIEKFKSIDQIYSKVKNKLKWLKLDYGQGLLFTQNLMHGNIVNTEKTTRVSFNCRFKSVFSPYRDKQIGNFFQPITIKPVTLIGMNYKHPND